MRTLLAAVIAVVLIALAVSAAVVGLFTEPAFGWLGFDPLALHFFDGRLGPSDLMEAERAGRRFSPREIAHLADVGVLLVWVGRLCAASAVLAVAAVSVAPRPVRLGASLALGGVALTGAGVVLAYALFGFVAVGVFFHRIVFPQGNWAFPMDSLIIHLYGAEVMVAGAAFVIVVAVGLIVALWAATRFLPRSGG